MTPPSLPKSPQEIARMASELMEALSDYITQADYELIERAKAGLTLATGEARVRDLLCQLYQPMSPWRFEVERLALEKDNDRA